MSAGLELERVTLAVAGRAPLIAGLSLVVGPAEIVTLIGPSGSGKSSLLSFLTGTLDPAFEASGRIRLDGKDVTDLPPERRRIGILFQDDLLFPHMTVGENLSYALPLSVSGRRLRRERILAALAEAQLLGFEDRDPATLSGGQRARVAVLRALLAEPKALLLDEPFARLDQALRAQFRNFVFEHARARGLPMLMVSHDPADAEAAEGPIITLETGGAELSREQPAAHGRQPRKSIR
ncbi:MAG: transporter, ATP-binding protein YnjD [Rhodospirillales bacterium]|jgi:putative thiamine transport system ATP-binding protein|nr:transporter, ATP-binding protein YnjD [Rhodospirillales bacterium]